MSIKENIHPIQKSILRILMYKPEARFSELNTENITSDHFTFHVKQLLEANLVEKMENGFYRLTSSGKEFTNRFDTDTKKLVFEKQAKIAVSVVCARPHKNENEYLMQQRLKQPYYGFYGFITGKMRWGERAEETAARELQEETGLSARLELAGIEHKMDYSKEGNLLEDKYFFIFRGTDTRENLVEQFEGGKNIWIPRSGVKKLNDVHGDVEEVFDVVEKGIFTFFERKFVVERY